ncbi:MAG: aldehyde dehydrogenase family protein, partial [Ignavibacteria bacterium]
MPEKFLVENKFTSSDKVKEIINPYSNEAAGEVYVSDGDYFNRSADYLTSVFEKYKSIPTYSKSELLYKISGKISQRKEELAKLITTETGKPIKFSRIEIQRAILTFRLGAEECSRIKGEVLSLDLLKGSENKLGIVRRFPVGLILGITPWNFPINLAAHKVSPALASSNVMLLKPSSNSMMCGIELGKIVLEASEDLGLGFCPVNVLTLSGADIDRYINDERIKMISFTGSAEIGWGIKKKAEKQRVSLELGGNAGVIADEGIDIDNAVSKIIIGGFSAAGQSCISVQRVYVNEKIYDEFRSKLMEEVKKVKFGNPFDEETISGPMITER